MNEINFFVFVIIFSNYRKTVETKEILVTPFQYVTHSFANVLISAPKESTSDYIAKNIDFKDDGSDEAKYFLNIYSSNNSCGDPTNETENFKRPFDVDAVIRKRRKVYRSRHLKGRDIFVVEYNEIVLIFPYCSM